MTTGQETLPVAGRNRNRQHSPVMVSGIVFVLSLAVLALFWYKQVRSYYFPYSDEFSIRQFGEAISSAILTMVSAGF